MQQTAAHLYQEIAEAIRRQIAEGELPPGERLPPVRTLARQWNCTPGTVSRAYALLAAEGLVNGHRGGGTRVAQQPLPGERPFLQWAAFIHRAEQFLLEGLAQGYSPAQAQVALSLAAGRWQALQEKGVVVETAVPTHELRFVGSHDLAVDLLARQLAEAQPGAHMALRYAGSLGGLLALARGEADVAGVHLWDEASGDYNLPFVSRMFPGQRVALITLAYRSLGLLLPPENPLAISGLADLTQQGTRWMNRQGGSGTRVWLDAQLRALNIAPEAIAGYEQETPTHLGVAQAIADGRANAGLAIHAAAAAYGLAFVPLTQEVYQLVVPEVVWETAVCQTLFAILQTDAYKALLHTLGGYDSRATGEVVWI
ncbi:MAG: GntR family transcriptional regulator [Chloroflexi bacterium]|nr:GntR family transcriptional regulator [Chloroflexota bacterium]